MISRRAKINDHWRLVRTRKDFQYNIKKISIAESEFTSLISIDVNSALISLCGKNGAGKSSVLQSIYYALNNESDETINKTIGSIVEIKNVDEDDLVKYGEVDDTFDSVIYLDASDDAINIRRIISSDNTFNEDYIENGNESEIINDVLGYVKKILVKDIISVTVFEIEGKLGDSDILPYFRIYKSNNCYETLEMGQGEHKVIYLIWRFLTMKNNSIVLLEEPEAFLCSKSQEYFMDFLAYVIQKKKLHVILTTHSDIVLRKQNITSCSIVKRNSSDKVILTRENSKSKYLDALGLKPARKGVFLVEDRFAKLLLQEIFLYFSSILSNEYYIDILNGESHILQLSKHYSSDNFRLIPILDADMKGKIKPNKYKLSMNYLPSVSNVAPEIEIVDYIKENKVKFSESIPRDTDVCLSAIDSNFSNHHDWFLDLDHELELNSSLTLEKIAIQMWIEDNHNICKSFLISLENIGIINKSKLKKESEKYKLSIDDVDFLVCNVSVTKYNLEHLIGSALNFSLNCNEGEIKSCIAI